MLHWLHRREPRRIFSFNGIDIKKESGEEFCILLGDNYGSDLDTQKTGTQEVEEAVLLIKNGIEEWIEENKGSRGHEIPEGTRFGYIGWFQNNMQNPFGMRDLTLKLYKKKMRKHP